MSFDFVPLELSLNAALAGKPWPKDPYLIPGATTPNMRMAWLVCGWAWTLGNSTARGLGEERFARGAKLFHYLRDQRRQGLYCITDTPRETPWHNEQNPPSHYLQWAHYIFGALVLARRIDPLGAWRDGTVIASECEWWISANLAQWSLVDRWRTGVVAMAGARAGQDRGDRGKDGVDNVGPRKPVNEARNRDWKACLQALKLRSGRPIRLGTCALAIREGWMPKLDAPLPYLAERMVIRWWQDGAISSDCPGKSPGQGGAQFVVNLGHGSWAVIDQQRAGDGITAEYWTPSEPQEA